MNAIREIRKVENGKVEIDLPKNFNGKNVEIIILISKDPNNISNIKKKKAKGKSLGGILHQYANPALISKEIEAWSIAVKEKYGIH